MIPLRRPQDVVQFTPDAAERIGRAVVTLENAVPAGKPLVFDRQDPATRRVFRICTFTGSWAIDATKTVTFRNQTTTPNTVSAVNLFWPVPDGPERACAVAKDGTGWYLIVPRMYAAAAATAASVTTSAIEFQTLPVVALATSGTATFSIPITTCGTATASP